MTCGFRNCQSRACGSIVRPDGHELAFCVAHEAIARHLPTLRTATCCTSEGCGRPQGSRSPLCKSCRPRYAAWGLDGYPAPQEAPMPTTPEAQTTPVTPYDVLDATAKVWFAMPQEERDACLVAISVATISTGESAPMPPAAPQDAAGGVTTQSGGYLACITPGCGDEDLMDLDQTTGLCGMCSRQQVRESKERDYEDNYVPVSEPVPAAPADDAARWRPMTAAEVEAALDTIMPLDVPAETAPKPACTAIDGEPSVGDVDDAYSGRWGQYTAPVQPMSADLAAIAARGQQPTAPGPTLADVQAELARERERADRAELDAVQERERADEAKAELAAIAALLDPEDAPAYDSDDQPIPLPTRVQTALMPGLTPSAREKRLQEAVDAYSQQLSDVDDVLHWLGAYGTINTVDRLMKVLTPEDRRNILELRAAIVREDIARLKARRLSPPPCGRMEEHAADLAAIEAKIAALPSLPPSTTPLAMEVR